MLLQRTGADPGFFLGGGALVSCSTSTPINHIAFCFCRIPVVLENRRSSGGGAHPLHPPPRSAPEGDKRNHCQLSRIVRVLHSSPCPPYRSPNLPDKTEFLTLLLSLEFCAIFQKFKNAFDHRTVSTAFFISTFQKIYKFRRLRLMS